MNDRESVRRLFARYAVGDIAENDLQRLDAALRADATLRSDFIEYMNVDSALGEAAALPRYAVLPDEPPGVGRAAMNTLTAGVAPSRRRKRRRLVASIAAIAATLLVFAGTWLLGDGGGAPAAKVVARVVGSIDAVLSRTDVGAWDQTQLPPGEYVLEKGLLHLAFAKGVVAYLEAPAQFTAIDDQTLALAEGRLSANVPPEGVGFTVQTPEADVVDHGTEFSIDVERDACEVHVFDGLVRVHPRGGAGADATPFDVRTLQAVRLNLGLPRPVTVAAAPSRFFRNFEGPRLGYREELQKLKPAASYRMPSVKGKIECRPPQHSGVVLLGEGKLGANAPGFAGAGLRVMDNSVGRGGIVENTAPLRTGEFTAVVFVFATALEPGTTVLTNLSAGGGCFEVSLAEGGVLRAAVRTAGGVDHACTSTLPLSLREWRHVIVTAGLDGLRIFEQGLLTAEAPCGTLKPAEKAPLFFGTNDARDRLWNGRLDEISLFDRALSESEINTLFEAARDHARKRGFIPALPDKAMGDKSQSNATPVTEVRTSQPLRKTSVPTTRRSLLFS
ncbi:MAG: LamG-like jellyroll fold domain-containing protein [Planctomycetota bacterium]